MPAGADQAARWASHIATYRPRMWGLVAPTGPVGRFGVDAGTAWFEAGEETPPARHRLAELEPDLFLADNGEVLDLRGSTTTWRNIELVRASGGPSLWQWALLAVTAAIALLWMVAAAAQAISGRRRSASAPAGRNRPDPRSRATSALAFATALLALANVALLAGMPALVDSGFVGWIDVALPLRLALHLPLAVALLGPVLVGVVVVGLFQRRWHGVARARYASLAVVTTALVAQLASWGLIGWGFS